VNLLLVFAVMFGLSDLSEAGGPFIDAKAVQYLRDVYSGEILYASSTVVTLVRRSPGLKRGSSRGTPSDATSQANPSSVAQTWSAGAPLAATPPCRCRIPRCPSCRFPQVS
jgi:hypothetical protein